MVMDCVVEDLDGGLVVKVERGRLVKVVSNLTEEVPHPLDFCTCKGRSIELSFR